MEVEFEWVKITIKKEDGFLNIRWKLWEHIIFNNLFPYDYQDRFFTFIYEEWDWENIVPDTKKEEVFEWEYFNLHALLFSYKRNRSFILEIKYPKNWELL